MLFFIFFFLLILLTSNFNYSYTHCLHFFYLLVFFSPFLIFTFLIFKCFSKGFNKISSVTSDRSFLAVYITALVMYTIEIQCLVVLIKLLAPVRNSNNFLFRFMLNFIEPNFFLFTVTI